MIFYLTKKKKKKDEFDIYLNEEAVREDEKEERDPVGGYLLNVRESELEWGRVLFETNGNRSFRRATLEMPLPSLYTVLVVYLSLLIVLS